MVITIKNSVRPLPFCLRKKPFFSNSVWITSDDRAPHGRHLWLATIGQNDLWRDIYIDDKISIRQLHSLLRLVKVPRFDGSIRFEVIQRRYRSLLHVVVVFRILPERISVSIIQQSTLIFWWAYPPLDIRCDGHHRSRR